MKAQSVILLLGGNEGPVLSNFSAALALIEQQAGRITRISKTYKTSAWGPVKQPDFMNMAVELRTTVPPGMLMQMLLGIEKTFGRKREIKYGPRTLDIDMIFYGQRIIHIPGLKVPHPEMHHRRFVLQPCASIIPHFKHPVLHQTVAELLRICDDPLSVNTSEP